mgnify:FL=1
MDQQLLDGIIFGLIDNFVLIIGGFTGLEVERWLPFRTVGVGAVLGAGVGNAVSDFLGGLPLDLAFAIGTFLGCLAGLVFIPVWLVAGKQPQE